MWVLEGNPNRLEALMTALWVSLRGAEMVVRELEREYMMRAKKRQGDAFLLRALDCFEDQGIMFIDVTPPRWRLDIPADSPGIWRVLHTNLAIEKVLRHWLRLLRLRDVLDLMGLRRLMLLSEEASLTRSCLAQIDDGRDTRYGGGDALLGAV